MQMLSAFFFCLLPAFNLHYEQLITIDQISITYEIENKENVKIGELFFY